MRKASTIAGLKAATPVQIWQDSTASRCCNYWAPKFFLINGHWYGYFVGGSSRALTGSEVMWEKSGVVYKYKVEVSTDNAAWTTVIDKTANTSTAQTQIDAFTAAARYVRITVTGLPASTWVSFFEFRVFGS